MEIKLAGFTQSRKVVLNGEELTPDKSFKYFKHSPDGFSWGYQGSGPAQLALAICLEVYGERTSVFYYYQEFKRRFIAPIPMNEDFDLTLTIPEYNEIRRRSLH